MRRKNTHKPKRMKRTSRRAAPKPVVTLAPLPRPAERHEPVKYSRIWP